MPLVADPYETMTIKIDKSSIPNSGEGLVAVRDIEAYELLALYSGFHLVGKTELDQHYSDCHNKTWPHNLPKGTYLSRKTSLKGYSLQVFWRKMKIEFKFSRFF